MKKLWIFSLIACVMILTGALGISAQDAATPEPGVSLAIYNQGTALVQDRRMFSFVEGENRIDFTDVASGIDPTSVTFVSLTDPLTSVIEQNYAFDLVNPDALLRRYIDQAVTVFLDDGTTYVGVLLSADNGIILQLNDGQIVAISSDAIRNVGFPDLPGGLITRPTLRWLISSPTTGEQLVQLTYLTGGLNWTADYNVLLSPDNAQLDLNGWITLTNISGATYTDANVKLIAGDVNRIYDQTARGAMVEYAMDALAAPAPAVEQRDISEYKLYEIARPVTVADRETKQVEFVSGAGIPATTYFVYESSYPYYGGSPIFDQYYGISGITTVQSWLEFTTDDEGGLGADLPAGRMRVFQEDVDGAPVLIGESTIDHTPEGETVSLLLGNAFDLVGERVQTDYVYFGSDVLEETYEITLRSRKDDETVEIRVPEHLFRWSNWQIVSSSLPYTQLDSNTIEFRASVAPDQEVVITYTVRYTFPR